MNTKTKLAIESIKGNLCIECGEPVNEDLRKWFKQKWVNIGKKDKSGKHPECGTSGEKRGYAKCVPASKARSMSKKDKLKRQYTFLYLDNLIMLHLLWL